MVLSTANKQCADRTECVSAVLVCCGSGQKTAFYSELVGETIELPACE